MCTAKSLRGVVTTTLCRHTMPLRTGNGINDFITGREGWQSFLKDRYYRPKQISALRYPFGELLSPHLALAASRPSRDSRRLLPHFIAHQKLCVVVACIYGVWLPVVNSKVQNPVNLISVSEKRLQSHKIASVVLVSLFMLYLVHLM